MHFDGFKASSIKCPKIRNRSGTDMYSLCLVERSSSAAAHPPSHHVSQISAFLYSEHNDVVMPLVSTPNWLPTTSCATDARPLRRCGPGLRGGKRSAIPSLGVRPVRHHPPARPSLARHTAKPRTTHHLITTQSGLTIQSPNLTVAGFFFCTFSFAHVCFFHQLAPHLLVLRSAAGFLSFSLLMI